MTATFKQPELWTAIVTGGASGIGAATARKLASRGIHVLIADVQDELGEKVAGAIKSEFQVDSIYLHVDVSKEADVQRMINIVLKKWGRLDYAANVAGFCKGDRDSEANVSTEVIDQYVPHQCVTHRYSNDAIGIIKSISVVSGFARSWKPCKC